MNNKIELIIRKFFLDPKPFTIKPLGSGLVHQTFLLKNVVSYVLQKINTEIFQDPESIAKNVKTCGDYLRKRNSGYRFIEFIPTENGQSYARIDNEYWRLCPFVENSYTEDFVETPEMAYEAARAVGSFAKNFNGLDPDGLTQTISGFHDLSFRFLQFKKALIEGLDDRKDKASDLIDFYKQNKRIADVFEAIQCENLLPKRIQHHDTKINNILFDFETHKAIAICDLDTVMPGYFISDLGDMIRTYTSAENEESTKWDEIKVRPDYYKALMEGYLSEMSDFLTLTEMKYLNYAGEFMIYMQGLRFLTDFLLGDFYYPVKHELHNFHRARNQMLLLEDFQALILNH